MITLPHPDPGTPDVRSAFRLMLWLLRRQAAIVSVGTLWGLLWIAGMALLPRALGYGIDLVRTSPGVASGLRAAGIVMVLAAIQSVGGIMRHRYAVSLNLGTASRVQQLTARHLAWLGGGTEQVVTGGEVVSVGGTDAFRISRAYDLIPRLIATLAAFCLVAVLLLQSSPTLGLVVIVGAPLVALAIGPLVRPLERRESARRTELGASAAIAADTVAGLRVLRGIGGEEHFLTRFREASQRVRTASVATAKLHATLEGLQILLPGLFVVGIAWLGARLALSGHITPGELVTFYAYAAFLVIPLRTVVEAAQKWATALAAAERVRRLLLTGRTVTSPAHPKPWPAGPVTLHDPASGLTVAPGLLTAVAADEPADARDLLLRLARLVDSGVAGARAGEVPLAELDLADVRRHVVYSETEPTLLTESLRRTLDPPVLAAGESAGPAGPGAERALAAACAEDIIAGLPEGLDTVLEERGRSLSGGQRQRVGLARVLASGAPVLLLDEPTSAVDAHTETRIAANLRRLRDGSTTVLSTTSPLVLDQAERVVWLRAGRVAATGTHRELLREHPAYRALVTRDEGAA